MTGTVATKNHEIDYLLAPHFRTDETYRRPLPPHEQLQAGNYGLCYVPTEDNLADLLTKILTWHRELAERIRCVERGEVSK